MERDALIRLALKGMVRSEVRTITTPLNHEYYYDRSRPIHGRTGNALKNNWIAHQATFPRDMWGSRVRVNRWKYSSGGPEIGEALDHTPIFGPDWARRR